MASGYFSTKDGYIPIAIRGFYANNSSCVPSMMYLASDGFFHVILKNTATTDATDGTFTVYITYIKK